MAYFSRHIGRIDRPPKVVIFLHICKIAIVVFLSIYMKSADIWFSVKKAKFMHPEKV
jgi:hypothetical protein